jgi:hypothetical protein
MCDTVNSASQITLISNALKYVACYFVTSNMLLSPHCRMKLFALAAIIATCAVSAVQVLIYFLSFPYNYNTIFAQISLQAAPAEAAMKGIIVYPKTDFEGNPFLIRFDTDKCMDIRPHFTDEIKSIEIGGDYTCTFYK